MTPKFEMKTLRLKNQSSAFGLSFVFDYLWNCGLVNNIFFLNRNDTTISLVLFLTLGILESFHFAFCWLFLVWRQVLGSREEKERKGVAYLEEIRRRYCSCKLMTAGARCITVKIRADTEKAV